MDLSYLFVVDIMMLAETQDNVAFNDCTIWRINQKGCREKCSWPNL